MTTVTFILEEGYGGHKLPEPLRVKERIPLKLWNKVKRASPKRPL